METISALLALGTGNLQMIGESTDIYWYIYSGEHSPYISITIYFILFIMRSMRILGIPSQHIS